MLAMALVAALGQTPWASWECPGFPCFTVNFYEHRKYDDIAQTCSPVTQMETCNHLAKGESMTEYASDGKTVVGTHVLHRPHPCSSANYGCWPTGSGCTLGSVTACHAGCSKLRLLDVYNSTCFSACDYMCASA